MLIDRQQTDPVGFHLEQARGAIADAQEFPRFDCVREQSLALMREHVKAALLAATLQLQAAEIEVVMLEAVVANALEAR